MISKNILIKADNIIGLKYLLDEKNLSGCIDLVYIDPPFATGNNFTVSSNRSNTISNLKNGNSAYKDILVGREFIEYLMERLFLIKELMSESGSIYLHTDYKIGHYVKIMMDEVFGINNFINDITRIKCNPKNFKRIGYGNIKDLILFYSKKSNPIWNEPKIPYTKKDIDKLYPKIYKNGRRYTTVPLHAPGETLNGNSNKPFNGILPPEGRHWRTDVETLKEWDNNGLIEWSSNGNPRKIIFADEKEGKRMQDIWEFKDPQYPNYPTEKNQTFLDLIIKTSSNENSIVLDCFCGSGTTLKSAQEYGRKWIGIDQSDIAIKTTKDKISSIENNLFLDNSDYNFINLSKNKTEEKELSTAQYK